MDDNESPENRRTTYTRPGRFRSIMNRIRPLKHEANRKMRLFEAILANNVDEALHLIKETGMTADDINTIVKRNTFLCVASIKGKIEIVRALIEAGADINKVDGYKSAPIHYACIKGKINTLRVLIEAGADVNKVDERGRTSLHIASGEGDIPMVNMLIEAGADVNIVDELSKTKQLSKAIHENNVDKALHLIKETGMTVDDINTRIGGITPLYRASYGGKIEIVRALIEAGADVNIERDINRGTPLHIACFRGHLDIVRALIEAGADVNVASDTQNDTPLQIASFNGHIDLVRALIAAGADINAVGPNNITALSLAKSRGHTNVVRALIAAGSHLKLNGEITERNFNLNHRNDPVSLEEIKEDEDYYMMNNNVNPYTRNTIEGIIESGKYISPTTRRPISKITRHKRPSAMSGGRKTRKHRKHRKHRKPK